MFLRQLTRALSVRPQACSATAAQGWQQVNSSTLVSLRAWRAPEQAEAAAGRLAPCAERFGAAHRACQQQGIASTAALREKVPLVVKTPPLGANRASTPSAAAAASAAAQGPQPAPGGPAASAAAPGPQPAPGTPAAPQGLAAVPSVARLLGFAGAIPFIALSPPIAQALPLLPAGLVANAALLQLGYGASIASFLGGIHWAMAMSGYGGRALSAAHETERYLWSVTPCLMAWPAVTLQPGPGALVLGATLGIVYAVDAFFAAKGLLPSWYMALRLPLTLAAVSGMLCTLVSSLLYGDQPRTSRRA